MMNNTQLKQHARHIRNHCLDMVYEAQSGHIGGALSACEILTYLYFEELRITFDTLESNQRDRFVLSKGHASALLYGTLYECGYIDCIDGFRQLNTRLQGHPCRHELKAIDMSSGSLGQGLSVAVGMALANRLNNQDYRTYVLLGDGECQEGQVWEACMSAAHYQLSSLCAIVDVNGLQIDGFVHEVMNVQSLAAKFEAFGWHVIEVNGHDFDALRCAFSEAKRQSKPTVLLASTIKGKGISFMENNPAWHGSPPNQKQYDQAKKELADE